MTQWYDTMEASSPAFLNIFMEASSPTWARFTHHGQMLQHADTTGAITSEGIWTDGT